MLQHLMISKTVARAADVVRCTITMAQRRRGLFQALLLEGDVKPIKHGDRYLDLLVLRSPLVS